MNVEVQTRDGYSHPLGKTLRLYKRRQVVRNKPQGTTQEEESVVSLPEPATAARPDLEAASSTTTTRSGCKVKLPARFRTILRPGGLGEKLQDTK